MSVVNALNLTGASLQGLGVLVFLIRSPLGDRWKGRLLGLGKRVADLNRKRLVLGAMVLAALVLLAMVILDYAPGISLDTRPGSGPTSWIFYGISLTGPVLYFCGDKVSKWLLERVPNDPQRLEKTLVALSPLFGSGVILQIIAISIRS